MVFPDRTDPVRQSPLMYPAHCPDYESRWLPQGTIGTAAFLPYWRDGGKKFAAPPYNMLSEEQALSFRTSSTRDLQPMHDVPDAFVFARCENIERYAEYCERT
jgi:hypothetical protein